MQFDRKETAAFGRAFVALPTLGGLLLAGTLLFWAVPLVERLPSDFSAELTLRSHTQFRQSTSAPWDDFLQLGRRTDHVLSFSNGAAVMQAGIAWSDEKGRQVYRTSGIYGVDPDSRRNLAGLGNRSRTGQFMLPPYFDQTTFVIWDPYYSGPRDAAYVRDEKSGGLPVRIYRFVAKDLDETEAYSFIPGVPSRYRVITQGEGQMTVEPVSGLIVDFTDRGRDSFVDRESGRNAGDFITWDATYSDNTRAAQRQRAMEQRRIIMAFRDWAPLISIGGGILWTSILLWRLRCTAPA